MAKKLIDKSIPRFLMVGVLNTLVGADVTWDAAGQTFYLTTAIQEG